MSPRRRAWLPLSGVALCAVLCAPGPAAAQRSLTLAEALQSAAVRDETIGIAEQDVASARAGEAAAGADLLPTAALSASRVRTDEEISRELGGGGEVIIQRLEYGRADLSLSTPLVNPTGIGELVAAGEARLAAVQQQHATEQEVLYGVVRTYYAALSARSAVRAAEASADAARTLEEAARGRLAAGTETVLGVDRARADRIAADGALEQARFLAQSSDLALAHAAGLPLAEPAAEAFALHVPERPTPPGGGTGVRIDLALIGRPDLLTARYSARSARTGITAAALRLAPELSLDWSWRYNENSGFSGDPESWTLTLQASWALPGLIGPAAAIASARAGWRRADLQVRQLERSLDLEIRSAELALDAAEAALVVARERDALAQANLDAGLRLYTAGLATGLEVSTLNSERDEAAADLVWSTLERDLAEVALLEALGEDPLAVYGAEE